MGPPRTIRLKSTRACQTPLIEARRIAVFCGSREWPDRECIRSDLESLPDGSVVIAERVGVEEIGLQAGHHPVASGRVTANMSDISEAE
jgi:hypothetical protein